MDRKSTEEYRHTAHLVINLAGVSTQVVAVQVVWITQISLLELPESLSLVVGIHVLDPVAKNFPCPSLFPQALGVLGVVDSEAAQFMPQVISVFTGGGGGAGGGGGVVSLRSLGQSRRAFGRRYLHEGQMPRSPGSFRFLVSAAKVDVNLNGGRRLGGQSRNDYGGQGGSLGQGGADQGRRVRESSKVKY